MTLLAVFGINNDALNAAVNVLLLLLVVLWLALVWWTFTDARRRIDDPLIVGSATLASLVPFVGTLVYMIVRPPEYLEDVRLRRLETEAAEARLYDGDHQICSHCEHPVRSDYLRCPSCQRRLKEPCRSCRRPLDPEWHVCPYCETPVAAAGGPPEPTESGARLSRGQSTAEHPAVFE